MRKALLILVVLAAVINFLPQIGRWQHFKMAKAVVASGGHPKQFGLTGLTLTQCTISCNGGCCTSGALCSQLDTGRCPKTQECKGSMAGGDGTMLLLSTDMIGQAGIKNGGQLIAGCMSETMCEGGVAAGEGGCAGSGCGG